MRLSLLRPWSWAAAKQGDVLPEPNSGLYDPNPPPFCKVFKGVAFANEVKFAYSAKLGAPFMGLPSILEASRFAEAPGVDDAPYGNVYLVVRPGIWGEPQLNLEPPTLSGDIPWPG